MTNPDDIRRTQRKEEGKRKKRLRIEESGGIRPRAVIKEKTKSRSSADDVTPDHSRNDEMKQSIVTNNEDAHSSTPQQRDRTSFKNYDNNKNSGIDQRHNRNGNSNINNKSSFLSRHRFGRVMETVPCRNKPRFSTVSIALPGSVLSNCQTRELRTLLVGQIARAATLYHVDEIVVFDDKLEKKFNNGGSGGAPPGGGGWREFKRRKHGQDGNGIDCKHETSNEKKIDDEVDRGKDEQHYQRRPRSTHEEFMARLLQYCECPQYLRRNFFPMHPDLQFAGLLAPVDAPHHVRAEDRSKYREGIVLDKNSPNGNSFVNCGIRNRPVEIDRSLTPGIRCTVQIAAYGRPSQMKGTVVSPSAPREDDGTYWGFTTRMAKSINDVFEGCPFADGGYDLKIGTSERGSKSVEDKSFGLPKFQHSLIVFGGVAGIEECVDADESIKLAGCSSSKLFDLWLNTCPFQGSRTIRTEEAVMISLAKINPFLIKSAHDKALVSKDQEEQGNEDFSDESPSDESSEEEESSEDDNEIN